MTRRLLALCGLGLPLLAGCGGGPVGDWEDLAGVRDATIHKVALDTDYYGYGAVVDMDADATRDEIVTVLDALADWHKGRGGDDTTTVYVGGGTVELDDGRWSDGSGDPAPQAVISVAGGHARNERSADLLLRARRVLDVPVTVRDYEWLVTTAEPVAAARRILADAVLAAAPGVDIAPPEGAVGVDPVERVAMLSSGEVLTQQHLATYQSALANERLVRKGTANVTFVGSPTNELPRPTDRHPGLISIYMDLRLPGNAGPKTLAADPTQDPRWPVVAAQLDLLRGLPKGSFLWVSLGFGPEDEGSGPRFYRSLVEVTIGDEVPRQPVWNAAAAAYLAAR